MFLGIYVHVYVKIENGYLSMSVSCYIFTYTHVGVLIQLCLSSA